MNINAQYRTLGKANPVATPADAQPEELKAAYQLIAELEQDLLSVEAPMLLSAAVLVAFGCVIAVIAALISGA